MDVDSTHSHPFVYGFHRVKEKQRHLRVLLFCYIQFNMYLLQQFHNTNLRFAQCSLHEHNWPAFVSLGYDEPAVLITYPPKHMPHWMRCRGPIMAYAHVLHPGRKTSCC